MKRPIKILLMVFNQAGKGTYWRAFHWGRVLARWGHEVTLMATAPGGPVFLSRKPTGGPSFGGNA